MYSISADQARTGSEDVRWYVNPRPSGTALPHPHVPEVELDTLFERGEVQHRIRCGQQKPASEAEGEDK